MNISHQIFLSANEWSDFDYRLNHPNPLVSENSRLFMTHIHTNISTRVEGNNIFVSSDSIDEDAILSALFENATDPSGNSEDENSIIYVNSSLTFDSRLLYVDNFADFDSYYDALSATGMNFSYQATQSSRNSPLAA